MKPKKLLNPTKQFIILLFVLTFCYACEKDKNNPDYAGTWVATGTNQSQFSSLLSQSGMEKTFKSEYSISANNLTLKTDINKDGDYNDENEVTIYTKQ